MEIAIFTFVSVLVLLLSIGVFGRDGSSESDNIIIIGLSFMLAFTALVLMIIYAQRPKAIDVYKGETTLEITYKDGMPIDSVVVWKNNK